MSFLRYREDTIHDEIRRRIYNALNQSKGGTLGPYSAPSRRQTQELADFLALEKQLTTPTDSQKDETELKPCPWCGKSPAYKMGVRLFSNKKPSKSVYCETEGCPAKRAFPMAAEDWNRRSKP